MAKKRITKKPKDQSMLVHWLKGHNIDHWEADVTGPARTYCSCGVKWDR
jgi:hypothetical protein